MKKLLIVLLTLGFLCGCTSKTKYGECIGVDDEEVATLEYNYSTKNIILGVIFLETIIVPAIVLFDQIKCPIAKK